MHVATLLAARAAVEVVGRRDSHLRRDSVIKLSCGSCESLECPFGVEVDER
jgi:hypothetical protein